MSAAIKRMLTERAEREETSAAMARASEIAQARRWSRLGTIILGHVDRAAPFIDAECPPNKWRPSSLLRIMLCASDDNDEAEREAANSVLDHLELARRRARAGLHPNPFLGEPEQTT